MNDSGQESGVLPGEDDEASHQENGSESNKEPIAGALPAAAVVEHLSRLKEHK